jgi:hypothetical protein
MPLSSAGDPTLADAILDRPVPPRPPALTPWQLPASMPTNADGRTVCQLTTALRSSQEVKTRTD